MGDLLKNFRPIPETDPSPSPPTLANSPPTQERKPEINLTHLDKSRHVSTTVGQSTHPRGRVGRKTRIWYQESKQEKAYRTSLESKWRLPTVGEREKRAAHWSDVLNSYEDRTENTLYCCYGTSSNPTAVMIPQLQIYRPFTMVIYSEGK